MFFIHSLISQTFFALQTSKFIMSIWSVICVEIDSPSPVETLVFPAPDNIASGVVPVSGIPFPRTHKRAIIYLQVSSWKVSIVIPNLGLSQISIHRIRPCPLSQYSRTSLRQNLYMCPEFNPKCFLHFGIYLFSSYVFAYYSRLLKGLQFSNSKTYTLVICSY